MKTLFTLLLTPLTLIAGTVFTAPPTNPPPQVQVAWDAIADPTVTNVNVYWGTSSRNYTNFVGVPTSTNGVVIPLPTRGVVYFFAATCVNNQGLESQSFSTEVNYGPINPPNPPNVHPLLILHVQSSPPPPPGQWSNVIDYSISPDATNQLFRLLIAQATAPAVNPQIKALNALHRALLTPP